MRHKDNIAPRCRNYVPHPLAATIRALAQGSISLWSVSCLTGARRPPNGLRYCNSRWHELMAWYEQSAAFILRWAIWRQRNGVIPRLLPSYHGRAICALHISDNAGALLVNSRWHGTASSNFPPTVDSSSGQLPKENNDRSFEHVTTRWAVAKSQLRRAAKDAILPVVQQFSALFLGLAHQGRAAEVLAYGASLMERLDDCRAAYILLKEAYKLNSGSTAQG